MARVRASEVEALVGGGWRMVIVGALVLVTCDPGVVPAVEVAAQGFLPASVGDTWTYAIGQTTPGLVMPGATSTERIVSGGPRVFRQVSEHAGNPAANSERSVVYTADGLTPDIGTMATAIGPVSTVESRGLFLPHVLTPGLRWSWSQRLDSPISTMDVAGSAEVIGEQQVTVPAGTFAAVLVRSETRNHVVGKGGTIPPMEHAQRDDSWYVRGLGLVRNVTHGAAGYTADKRLVAYSVRGAPASQATQPQIAEGAP